MISVLTLTTSLLFAPTTPLSERSKAFVPYFSPPPGSLLQLDRLSLLENGQRPSYIQGTVWVKPPKGQCFILRTDPKRRDKRICKPTPVTWEIEDLDAFGRLNFQVLLDAEWDEGMFVTWKTPYRLGNFVAAGKAASGEYDDIPIKTCTAETIGDERSILLESFEGRRWRISLPEFDTPVHKKEAEIPNLMVNIDSKKKANGEAIDAKGHEDKADPKAGGHDEHGDAADPKKDEKKAVKPPPSVLGQLLTTGFKEEEVHEVKFILPGRGAFTMESGRFNETGAPKGMNGECRYMYKNAPGDNESGAIECHDTDTLDSVYVHLTCFPQLKPRLAKKPKDSKEVKEAKP